MAVFTCLHALATCSVENRPIMIISTHPLMRMNWSLVLG
jgi:hypothetical protein